jgi:hypothetical protein
MCSRRGKGPMWLNLPLDVFFTQSHSPLHRCAWLDEYRLSQHMSVRDRQTHGSIFRRFCERG